MTDKKPTAKKPKKPISKARKSKASKSDEPKPLRVPTVLSGVKRNAAVVKRFWKPLLKATSVYGGLYFVFIRVLTQVNFDELNDTVVAVFGKGEESILTRAVSVSTLFGQSTSFDSQTGVLFFVISIVCSLAFVWLLRAFWAGRKADVKEAYYQGMYPFVPVVLVIIVMFLQAIPFTIGTFMFQTAFDQGLAASLVEKIGFVGVLMAGILLSGYWLIGSLMAFYAVTVPGKTPSEARSATAMMLKGRRFAVLRNSIMFLLLTGLMILAPMLLVIYLVQSAAIVVAAIFIVVSLPWLHIYFYGLYRDLLNE